MTEDSLARFVFDEDAADPAARALVARFVDETDRFDQLARAALRADAANPEGNLREYRELHDENDIGDPSLTDDEFVASLTLHAIGLAPRSDHGAAVFDYVIDFERSQYVLCVKFDLDGNVIEVNTES